MYSVKAKIVTVVGARPQFIKAAALSRRIRDAHQIEEVVVHTGQHYDDNMSAVFFEQLTIAPPRYNLGIGGGTHGAMTGRQLEKVEQVLDLERPDVVVVYGDTNSTLAGALAAVKMHIPVAHVEAGLRSFNRRMPEEINRVLVDHMASQLFAPNALARENLLAEGIPSTRIHVVGDVMCDAARYYRGRAKKPHWFDGLGVSPSEFVLCTIHRAENTENRERLARIFLGLQKAAFPVVLPLHPRTRARLSELSLQPANNIFVVDPVGYLEMVWLEANCRVVATDSGGVQKEAYWYGKPCVTLRDETEWLELVHLGVNRLVGDDCEQIVDALRTASFPSNVPDLYGDGAAAERVLDVLIGAYGRNVAT